MENDEEQKKAEERTDFLKEARELASRNEKAVEEMRKLVERNEELTARKILGGHTDAGLQPVKPAELSAAEYAKQISQGKIPN